MKLKSLLLVTMILSIQPQSTWAVQASGFSRTDFRPIYKNNDHVEIDFDVIDEELALLGTPEQKPNNSWWVTKQTKRLFTKMMVKALLGYIAMQEFCNNTWSSFSTKMGGLARFYGFSKF